RSRCRARGVRTRALVPARDGGTAPRARCRGAQRDALRQGAGTRRKWRPGDAVAEPARPAVAVRGDRLDLFRLRGSVPLDRDCPRRISSQAHVRPLRRVARGVGVGGGERDPRDPRPARSRARGDWIRRRARRGGAAEGIAVSLAHPLAQAPRRRVSLFALLRVFWRSLFLQAAWNPRGMQNLGFAFAMQPALRELYPDPRARARAAERHLEFFNCHPYLAAAIVGGAVRLEEDVARGAADPRRVSAFKAALGPPFAALGDGFFWLALRPAAALIAAVTEPYLGLSCVPVFPPCSSGVHLAR